MQGLMTSVKPDRVPFLEYPSSKRDDRGRRQCLVFFISGNPGLIAYYKPFLSTLRERLDEAEAQDGCGHAYHIYGRNLLGFDDDDHEPSFGTPVAGAAATEPFTLEDQICCLCDVVQIVNKTLLGDNRAFDDVVLVGHSVGAYICLEIFNRHHQARRAGRHDRGLGAVRLKAGVLLFPTISHIAQSSSGQKLDLIRRTPFLDRNAHHFAKGFVNLWPRRILDAFVRHVLGFPEHAAVATVRFLTSRDGIWQALHMGKDEMKTITEEKWSDELWEIREAEEEEAEEEEAGEEGKEQLATKFFFYFAKKDHWVADACRDEFIERRKRHERGRARIVIDEQTVPHAFCIHHSEAVAEKVALWIGDIAGW